MCYLLTSFPPGSCADPSTLVGRAAWPFWAAMDCSGKEVSKPGTEGTPDYQDITSWRPESGCCGMEHNPLPTSPADQVSGPFCTYQDNTSISVLSRFEQGKSSVCLFHSHQDSVSCWSLLICISFIVSALPLLCMGENNDRFCSSGNTFPLSSLELLRD